MPRRHLLPLLALALCGLTGNFARAQGTADVDEQVLKSLGVATDDKGLLQFFKHRSLKDDDRKVLAELVKGLDSEDYQERKQAMDELLARGPVVLKTLKDALSGKPSLELRRRAEDIIKKIESQLGNDASAAAARLMASRQLDGGIDVLLGYLPAVDDAWLEDEVLISLGRLAIRGGKVDKRLLDALDDPALPRKAAAVYLLGRRGDLAHREKVRTYLDAAEPLLKQRAAQGLFGKRVATSLADSAAGDETLLKTQNVTADDNGLLGFLRKRTLSEADQQRLAQLVRDLGSTSYEDRYNAAEALIKEGTPSLAFLRPAEFDPDAEVSRRAKRLMDDIRRGPGPAVPIAVAHLLVRRPHDQEMSAKFLRTLLDYVPFADDEQVEDEVLNCLTLLSLSHTKVEPALIAALKDPLPARRGAAAFVLGHVGTQEQVAAIGKLLDDPSPTVRQRATQGLLAARDGAAVPRLIALLNDAPPTQLWKLEETLQRLAGDKLPVETIPSPTAENRKKAADGWQKWWEGQAKTADLARLSEGENYLGLITVSEYDSVVGGRFTGQVWESPRNGEPRWKMGNLIGPMDAHVLSNGRILVAENGQNRVTERDIQGAVKWEFPVQNANPIACQRLANGNTFIACYNQLIEVRPDKTEVYRYNPGPQFYIFGAHRTAKGTVVCATAQGTLLEVDPVKRETVRTIPMGQPAGGWCGVESLPNGRFLVSTMNSNLIREIDASGKEHWRANFQGVFRATKMPNGNVLAVSMTSRQVAEIDRSGAVRWSKVCQGRPWNVHWR